MQSHLSSASLGLLTLRLVLLLLCPLGVYLSGPQRVVLITIATILTGGLDIVDGVLARRKNEDSALRRLLDSSLDRINVNLLLCIATLWGQIPLLLYVPVLIRELFLVCGGAVLARRSRAVIHTRMLHKSGNLLLALALVFWINGIDSVGAWVIGYLAMTVGLIDYIGIFVGLRDGQSQRALFSYFPRRFEGLVRLRDMAQGAAVHIADEQECARVSRRLVKD